MSTPPPLPLSPKVATPLAHRKRRHSEMTRSGGIDLTRDIHDGDQASNDKQSHGPAKKPSTNGVSTTQPSPADHETNGASDVPERKLEDDEIPGFDDDADSMLEDILDTAELEPYKADLIEGDVGLDSHTSARLRARLLRIGVDQFFEETLKGNSPMSPAILGTAFGLKPEYYDQLGDEIFMRVLGHAVTRAYFKRQKLSAYNTIDDAASLLKKSRNIMVITGAGISTSLGIPDFRSKETGYYTKLQAKGISEPEEVFDITEFDYDPNTFYSLARDILPDLKRFSPTHAFIRLLQDKNRLQTNYTQNIDNIEALAGIEKSRLIQCHGSFGMATCRKCGYKVKGTEIFPAIRQQRVAYCTRCQDDISASNGLQKSKKRPSSKSRFRGDDSDDAEDDDIPVPGVMKPDITFFGEQLPDNFFTRFTERDVKTVDLVLVIGTSLKVAPVSEMPNFLPHQVPHIYISREPIEHVNFDVQLLGDCDDVAFELCRRAGWELKHEMIPKGFRVRVEPVDGSDSRWRVRKFSNEQNGSMKAKAKGIVANGTVAEDANGRPS